MINFLEEKYGAKVSCNQVCQDGYEVTNLLSKSANKSFFSQNKGFLVEHFIKPPVDISFVFPIPIQISCIDLGLFVGAQRTNGIEILVADHQDVNGVLRAVFHQCPIFEQYLKVSNTSFRARPPFLESNKNVYSPLCNSKAIFKFSHLMNHVRTIRLRLTRTEGSSVPALGSIKVLGIPAKSCKQEELVNILRLHKNCFDVPANDPDIEILPSENSKEIKKASSTTNVPEEFLDALTFEIMTRPVLLPSGHSVDQSTLEKSNASQSTWGRIPCDPFTGIPFGAGRQPVTNAPLKARIDVFLVKNAHLDPEIACLPRPLGEKPKEVDVGSTASSSHSTHSSGRSFEIYGNGNFSDSTNTLLVEPELKVATPITSHEKALEDSLSTALKAYSKNTYVQRRLVSIKETNSCVGCRVTSSGPQYKLPCDHSVCRTCLLKSHNFCLKCKKSFQRDQVYRTYKTS